MKPIRYFAYACALGGSMLGIWWMVTEKFAGVLVFCASSLILQLGPPPQPPKKFWSGWKNEWKKLGLAIVGIAILGGLALWVTPALPNRLTPQGGAIMATLFAVVLGDSFYREWRKTKLETR